MPTADAGVSRRRVLIGATAAALLGPVATAACRSTPPVQEVDALLSALDRARADDLLATDAAAGAPRGLAPALSVVAAERAAHARALTDEITRLSGEAPTTTPSASSASSPSATSPTSTSAAPPAPPTSADVVASLSESADSASLLATQQSGYRAGLLGSIAAACTAAATVTLAGGRPPS